MKRIDGFVDLDEMIKTGEINYDLPRIVMANPFYLDSFLYNGERYFVSSSIRTYYNELLIEELLKDFGLESAYYDIGIFQNDKCVFTKDFRKKDINYLYARDILNEYADYIKKFSLDESRKINHSLANMWNALDYHYRNKPNRESIVYYLMDKIVDLFIFDILTCQNDRHSRNYQIAESKDNITLAPIYDSDRIFWFNTKNETHIQLPVDNNLDNELFSSLKRFIDVSDYDYYDRVKDKLWVISDENLKSAFKRIENKIGVPLKDALKNDYLNEFRIHRRKIEELLAKTRRKKI